MAYSLMYVYYSALYVIEEDIVDLPFFLSL